MGHLHPRGGQIPRRGDRRQERDRGAGIRKWRTTSWRYRAVAVSPVSRGLPCGSPWLGGMSGEDRPGNVGQKRCPDEAVERSDLFSVAEPSHHRPRRRRRCELGKRGAGARSAWTWPITFFPPVHAAHPAIPFSPAEARLLAQSTQAVRQCSEICQLRALNEAPCMEDALRRLSTMTGATGSRAGKLSVSCRPGHPHPAQKPFLCEIPRALWHEGHA